MTGLRSFRVNPPPSEWPLSLFREEVGSPVACGIGALANYIANYI